MATVTLTINGQPFDPVDVIRYALMERLRSVGVPFSDEGISVVSNTVKAVMAP